MNLNLYVHCFDACLSRGPNNLYVYEPQPNVGQGLLQRETGLSPHYFMTDRSKAVLLLWFILIVFVRPFPVIIIITLFQEDNIFGTDASLTYGPQSLLTNC